VDTLSPEERSERMTRVRSKNMGPELVVRRLVFALGYRYRLHARESIEQQGWGGIMADDTKMFS
jgi:G:T-mismatch repair DNA endonuclease (very short patch repair protein)